MDNKSIAQIRHYAIKKEVIFLLQDGLMKVQEGLTTTEEVLRVVALSE